MTIVDYHSRAIVEGLLNSPKTDSLEGAPFRVRDYMTRNWFESILYSFKFTNEEATPYKYPFHDFSQMLRMYNKNTGKYITPGWITYLDESM